MMSRVSRTSLDNGPILLSLPSCWGYLEFEAFDRSGAYTLRKHVNIPPSFIV